MACEGCAIKFTLFKRKKQCVDCLRHFCTNCIARRVDRVLSCDNCTVLSQWPLVRSRIVQLRSRDLRRYLVAKKISTRGCVEKEDLVNLLMRHANGTDGQARDDLLPNFSDDTTRRPSVDRSNFNANSPPRGSRGLPTGGDGVNNDDVEPAPEALPQSDANSVDIREVSDSDCSPTRGPEPLVTEQEENEETRNKRHSVVFTELPTYTGMVKLSDITRRTELEYLSVKQLKDLLSINRVDFKGCVERCELLDRASRLWEEHRKSRADAENLDEESLCKICLDAPIECVMLECGHMACCINCGKQMSECPICRQYVVRVVRFFKA